MFSLRVTYEHQLISLKQEAHDTTSKANSLSHRELLSAINYYLHYFNCETWTAEELLDIERRLNHEAGTVETAYHGSNKRKKLYPCVASSG